jgi:hypothetical protein
VSEPRRRRIGMTIVLLAYLASTSAGQGRLTEYQVKAAYLYNFAKFVKWPAGAPDSPTFSICILGDNPFGQTLDTTVAGEKLDGKDLSTRKIKTPAEAMGCRIVYVGKSEQAHLPTILPALAKHHVLTVSDAAHFCEKGGMIGFVMDGERVRFHVNVAAAQASGLTLSSDLLKVAMEVKNASGKGVPR